MNTTARDRFVAFAFCWADMLVELVRLSQAGQRDAEIVATEIERAVAQPEHPQDAPLRRRKPIGRGLGWRRVQGRQPKIATL